LLKLRFTLNASTTEGSFSQQFTLSNYVLFDVVEEELFRRYSEIHREY